LLIRGERGEGGGCRKGEKGGRLVVRHKGWRGLVGGFLSGSERVNWNKEKKIIAVYSKGKEKALPIGGRERRDRNMTRRIETSSWEKC